MGLLKPLLVSVGFHSVLAVGLAVWLGRVFRHRGEDRTPPVVEVRAREGALPVVAAVPPPELQVPRPEEPRLEEVWPKEPPPPEPVPPLPDQPSKPFFAGAFRELAREALPPPAGNAVALRPSPPPPETSAAPPPDSAQLPSAAGPAMVQAAPLPEASPPPAYPRLAWRRGYEGRVRLLVTVSVQGLPVGIEVLGSSGHESLDEAAIEAVRKWRFQPATTAGRPVESRLVVPVRFRIDS